MPNGFAVTADAYRELLRANALHERLAGLLTGVDGNDTGALQQAAAACRTLLGEAEWPAGLAAEIETAHARLAEEYGGELTVAVRSSATAEDLPEASFAGQHDSFLNVGGGAELLDAYRRCLTSAFTERAVQTCRSSPGRTPG